MFWKWRSQAHAGQPRALPSQAAKPLQLAYRQIDRARRGTVTPSNVLAYLATLGLLDDDDRIQEFVGLLRSSGEVRPVSEAEFVRQVERADPIVARALAGQLVIPDFPDFAAVVREEAEAVRRIDAGQVARYIPELAKANPAAFGAALCTIDGQRMRIGDALAPFTIQSVSKVGLYGLALDLHGREAVHRYVGREPSGQRFNALTLNEQNLPHNPMINAGAIMCSSLILPDKPLPERFEALKNLWSRLSAGRTPGFSNAVYTSERQSGDRNYALAYFMRENKVFPPKTDIMETLDLYFQACAMESNADNLALAAASLANGGMCPITGKQAIANRHVKNCLTMMFTNGMYNYSGEFAFLVGLPAKSGVSGVIVAVVPGLLGLVIWSPPVDEKGNSVRGQDLCKRLTARFNFHIFDGIDRLSGKTDPRQPRLGKS